MNQKVWKKLKKQVNIDIMNNPDIIDVLRPYIVQDKAGVKRFIQQCRKNKKSLLMLNRIYWYLELADTAEHDSVKVLFCLAMAESVIKLRDGRFDSTRDSTDDVRIFFNLSSRQEKDEFRKYFKKCVDRMDKIRYFSFEKAISALSNVRHRVVHGKNHYDFSFHIGNKLNIKSFKNFQTGFIDIGRGRSRRKRKVNYEFLMTYDIFRDFMLRTSLGVLKNLLDWHDTGS